MKPWVQSQYNKSHLPITKQNKTKQKQTNQKNPEGNTPRVMKLFFQKLHVMGITTTDCILNMLNNLIIQ
jgi:hypothetical protein